MYVLQKIKDGDQLGIKTTIKGVLVVTPSFIWLYNEFFEDKDHVTSLKIHWLGWWHVSIFPVSWSVRCFSIWKISLFTILWFFKPNLYHYRRTINDEAILNKVDDDDFDALLAAADRLNSQCNYMKCKTLVKTLGTNCAHCNLR